VDSSSDPNEWDLHLRSLAGQWDADGGMWIVNTDAYLDPNGTPGYPNDDFWTQGQHSPCIDAGDPNSVYSDYSGELWPLGKRINMGAYGGTAEASMSLSDAGNIADLNNDDEVETEDLRLFGNDWLRDEVLLKKRP
jgi:hypothetical protein